jgi:hypothetical protein
MPRTDLTRRDLLLGGATGLAACAPLAALAEDVGRPLHVLHDPGCGCCGAWVRILRAEGFTVTTENSLGVALVRYKMDNGIPRAMMSCHTGRIGGYMIEGHVPAAEIRQLLAERPDAVGLAVPGMPYGSPGMGPESAREAYDVHLIRRDGSTEVFAHYAAA